MKWKIVISLVLVFLGISPILNAQPNISHISSRTKEQGLPILVDIPYSNQLHFLNFGMAQDSKGLIYLANGSGVGIYDGLNWDFLELPDKSRVYDIAVDQDDIVYVSSLTDMGYLEPNALGRFHFISLKDELPANEKKIATSFDYVFISGTEVYFISPEKVYHWKNDKFTITDIGFYHYANFTDKLLLVVEEKGIISYKDGRVENLIDTDFFRNMNIVGIERYDDGSLLIGTAKNGLYKYKGKALTQITTEISNELKDTSKKYFLKMLRNGNMAFAFNDGHLTIVDRDLEIKETVLIQDGLSDFFEDKDGFLWLLQRNRIQKYKPLSSLTVYNEQNGIRSNVLKVLRYKDTLFASQIGNDGGVAKLVTKVGGGSGQFSPIPQLDGWSFHMEEIYDRIIMVKSDGLYEYNNGKSKLLAAPNSEFYPFSLGKSSNPRRFYVGCLYSLWCGELDNRDSLVLKKIVSLNHRVDNVFEMPGGTLWLTGQNNELRKVSFRNEKDKVSLENAEVATYGPQNNLPNGRFFIYNIQDEVYFNTTKYNKNGTLFRFDNDTDSFYKDTSLVKELGLKNTNILVRTIDENYNLVFTVPNREYDEQYVAWYKNGKYRTEKLNHPLPDSKEYFMADLEAKDSIIWFYWTEPNFLYRKDLTKNPVDSASIQTQIRSVNIINDSTLYYGYNSTPTKNLELPIDQGALRFQYVLLDYKDPESNTFQYKLEGYDELWSPWTMETKKDYTNLKEGQYSFKVRGRNIAGKLGAQAVYKFKILSPWYRSWWAYLGYVLLGGLALWVFAQWRSQQLRSKNLALEAVVNERTEEIREKNKLLGHQTEKLKEMDTMKTRLFSNISHEFRTPLTLIKGPIDKLESAGENKISTPNIKMIRRNSNRLLNLVNQLLDLSKLDSGKLKLNRAEGDVFKCIRAAASSFSSHAASRQMDYQIKISPKLLWASFDRDKFEKIIYNLLSNAFKFTADEERIIIEAEFRSGRLKMKVADTGGGISSDKLPHIFDRFFQVDDSYTKEKAGSGIGLALTKELVELMGGTIFVESELGKGTIFRVVIPLEEIQSGKISEEVEEVPTNIVDVDTVQSSTTISESNEIKILIIEDNNDMRHFIREQLEADYAVFEAVNGKEGLKLANKLMPDLIVTDLMMPQMDGITLCKKLKTDLATSHIPVIMLTAKAGIENKLEGLETGADDYLTKPFNARELQIRTQNLITQRQQLRESFSKNISLDPQEIAATSLDEKFLQQVLSIFENKYVDSQFGVPQMQKELGMSKTSLHSKIKVLTNHPPGELLRNFRLQRARQLLTRRADNISQVAYDVGFNSLSYFTRCFKEYYGTSPSEFLKNES